MSESARTFADVVDTIVNGEFYEDYDQSVTDLGILRAALAALDRPAAPDTPRGGDGVGVRKLEWQRSAKANYFAKVLWGTYSVEYDRGWAWSCLWKGSTAAMLHRCESEEAGKAGAQADYDQYIRSAALAADDGRGSLPASGWTSPLPHRREAHDGEADAG